jgi:hypothetical protein
MGPKRILIKLFKFLNSKLGCYTKAIQTTTHDVGYYALGGPNLSKLYVTCTFDTHLHLTTSEISLDGLGSKILTAGVPGRGVHRPSTGELDGIFQLHQRCAQRGHNDHLWLLGLHRRRLR